MNVFDIEILEDGKVSLKAGEFSDIVHIDADNLLKELEETLGGEISKDENEELRLMKKSSTRAARNVWNRRTVKAR